MQFNTKSLLLVAFATISGFAAAQEGAVGLVKTASLSVPASARPEPNAFIGRKCGSLADLIEHVKSDSTVMGRFTRHFGMSREQVLDMLAGLHADTLREDGVYLVYNTPETGEIRARSIFYKRGTPVYSDAMGNPVLKASCGNPMVRGTDAQLSTPAAMLASEADLQPVAGEAVAAGPTESVPLAAVAPAEAASAPLAAVASSMPSEVLTTSSRSSSGLLALIPLAALATIKTSGGGGGNTVCDPKTNPQCIPEPFTMVLMGTGIAGLVARRVRKNKA